MELVRPVTRAFLHDFRHDKHFGSSFLALENEAVIDHSKIMQNATFTAR